jgi:hypothetical protein
MNRSLREAGGEILYIGETDDNNDIVPTHVSYVARADLPEQGENLHIQPDLDRGDLIRARAVLNRAGVRKLEVDGTTTIGIWSDLDGPDIRAALLVLNLDRLPVAYLDGTTVAVHQKGRLCAEPWIVRDRMLKAMGWCPDGLGWPEWKMASLNRFFEAIADNAPAGPATTEDAGVNETDLGEATTPMLHNLGLSYILVE